MYLDRVKNINNSIVFQFTRKTTFPELSKLMENIQKELGFEHKKAPRYFNSLICNLYLGYMGGKSVAVARNCGFWNTYNKIRDRKQKLNFRLLIQITDLLKQHGYIDCILGQHSDYDKSLEANFNTRYFATEKLYSLFKTGWEEFIEDDETPTIKMHTIIKDKNKIEKKEAMQLTDKNTPEHIKELAKETLDYNNYLNTNAIFTYAKPYTYKQAKSLKQTKTKHRFYPFLQNIFNHGNWELGGRYYSIAFKGKDSYQGIKREDRKTIEINGNKTAEVDFKCMHVNLLYNSIGKEYKGDAYRFHENREVAKRALLIALNASTFFEARKALYNEVVKQGYNLSEEECGSVIERLQMHHLDIAGFFFNNDNLGSKMQYREFTIMRKILQECKNRGIVALPMHDGLIVEESKAYGVKLLALEMYKEVTGFSTKVEIK